MNTICNDDVFVGDDDDDDNGKEGDAEIIINKMILVEYKFWMRNKQPTSRIGICKVKMSKWNNNRKIMNE